jgi:hypothetical protein
MRLNKGKDSNINELGDTKLIFNVSLCFLKINLSSANKDAYLITDKRLIVEAHC